MTHYELTFSRAVTMATAAIAAGQLNYADREALENAILLFYDILLVLEFTEILAHLIISVQRWLSKIYHALHRIRR